MCPVATLSMIGAGITYAAGAIGTAAASTATAVGATAATAATVGGVTSTLASGAITGSLVGAGAGAIGGALTGKGAGKGALIGAGIGAAGGAAFSGLGMAANGFTTTPYAPAEGAAEITTKHPGLLSDGELVHTTAQGENAVVVTDSAGTRVVPIGPAETAGSTPGATAGTASAKGSLEVDPSALGKAALQLGSGALQAYSGNMDAKANADGLDEAARINRIRAAQAIKSGELEAADNSRKNRQLVGQGRAAAAANGVMLENRRESSTAIWEQDAAAELAWDNEKIAYNANLRAWGYQAEAANQSAQARALRRSGNLRMSTSLIRGGLNAIGSYALGSVGGYMG